MKSLLLVLAAGAALAGCAVYPAYEPAYYTVPQPAVQSSTPGATTPAPVYAYPYPYAYPYAYAYPYGYYGGWYPSVWISGSYWCCSSRHSHRWHHGGSGRWNGGHWRR